MRITKNIISREKAAAISPDYVAFAAGDFSKFKCISDQFESVKKGQKAITALEQNGMLIFIDGKITSVSHNNIRAVDGPVVRFGNDEFTWRIDGDKYAFLLKNKTL